MQLWSIPMQISDLSANLANHVVGIANMAIAVEKLTHHSNMENLWPFLFVLILNVQFVENTYMV